MKLKDFTGKLNDNRDYLKMIDILENKSFYIEIVVIDEKDNNDWVKEFSGNIIDEEIVSKWWGTETSAKNNLYRIQASKDLFSKLKKYETFCKYYVLDSGDSVGITDFGYDDIAFFDKNKEVLLFTTTHEGYITVREDLEIL